MNGMMTAQRRRTRTSPIEAVIVDDHQDTVEMMAETLRHHGFAVRAFSDPREALASMRAASPDVAVVDLRMPGMSGVDLGHALRGGAETRGIALVALTGAEDIGVQVEAVFDVCLRKPIDLASIPDLLRALADTRASGERAR